MVETIEKLQAKDLSIGMKVSVEQLSEVYDIYMILLYNNDDRKTGTLVYMNKVQTPDYDAWFNQSVPITPIYNSSSELGDLIVYDE